MADIKAWNYTSKEGKKPQCILDQQVFETQENFCLSKKMFSIGFNK